MLLEHRGLSLACQGSKRSPPQVLTCSKRKSLTRSNRRNVKRVVLTDTGATSMGTGFFKSKPKAMTPSGMNMEARAINSGAYAGRAAAGGASKALGVAAALNKAGSPKALTKTSAVAAPGPKKV
jgi:hypothetical protein